MSLTLYAEKVSVLVVLRQILTIDIFLDIKANVYLLKPVVDK